MQRRWIFLVVLLLGMVTSGFAWADRGRHFHDGDRVHGSIHFYFGPPGFSPWYYGPHYYYPYYGPPVVIVPSSPPTYIERGPDQAEPSLTPGYWYYCTQPKGYYPYVKECPGGWEQVAPQPPAQP